MVIHSQNRTFAPKVEVLNCGENLKGTSLSCCLWVSLLSLFAIDKWLLLNLLCVRNVLFQFVALLLSAAAAPLLERMPGPSFLSRLDSCSSNRLRMSGHLHAVIIFGSISKVRPFNKIAPSDDFLPATNPFLTLR